MNGRRRAGNAVIEGGRAGRDAASERDAGGAGSLGAGATLAVPGPMVFSNPARAYGPVG